MTFELLPIIDTMIDLYEKPRTFERFQEYLKTLQGDTKGDLVLPISGFNPMAKEHLLDRLTELRNLDAEHIMKEALKDLNDVFTMREPKRNFRVALNLSDDLKGGWTNPYTSDYDSKFKISGLVNRDFCTPVFWASEGFTKDKIRLRTLEYIFRTIHWLANPKPKTLKDHIEQEIFVATGAKSKTKFQETEFTDLNKFYEDNRDTDSYPIIFNFFYGDKASKSMEFPTNGIVENITGFDFAAYRAKKK